MHHWGMILGTNQMSNCGAALIIDGIDVFRLRSGETNDQFLVDFDIHGQDGSRLVRIAKNQVVHTAPGYTVTVTADACEVKSPSDEVVAKVVRLNNSWLKINGVFWSNGSRLAITDEHIQINDYPPMTGNISSGNGVGWAFNFASQQTNVPTDKSDGGKHVHVFVKK